MSEETVSATANVTAAEPDTQLPVGTVDDILSGHQPTEEWVDVPEWNCRVKVRALTKGDQTKARAASLHKNQIDMAKMEGFLFVAGVVEPPFHTDHIAKLANVPAKAFDRVMGKIYELSGMTDDTDEEQAQFLV